MDGSLIIQNLKSSRQARANRLKSIRKLTRLSRREFSEAYAIPKGTLQNWEDGRYGGLTIKGAERIARVLDNEGVHCTPQWLLDGVGPGPLLSDRLFLRNLIVNWRELDEETSDQQSQEMLIKQELLFFRQNHQNVLDTVISDDAMLPRFVAGEYVAGVACQNNEFTRAINQECILRLHDDEIMVRRVLAGESPDLYTLTLTNSNGQLQRTHENVRLLEVAPIIWTRRKSGGF